MERERRREEETKPYWSILVVSDLIVELKIVVGTSKRTSRVTPTLEEKKDLNVHRR